VIKWYSLGDGGEEGCPGRGREGRAGEGQEDMIGEDWGGVWRENSGEVGICGMRWEGGERGLGGSIGSEEGYVRGIGT
jgi:hypothetical protein